MGKKRVGFSKRKRKACLIEQCKNMTKKRKQSLEQSSASTVVESSLDRSQNKTMSVDFTEDEQDNNSPRYAELENIALECAPEAPVSILFISVLYAKVGDKSTILKIVQKYKTEIIQKDDKFWADVMEPKLLKFYYDCLLPELVDPRHIRNKPIRDPEYVIGNSNENTVPNILNINSEESQNIFFDNTISDNNKVNNIADVSVFKKVSGVAEVTNVEISNYVMPFAEY